MCAVIYTTSSLLSQVDTLKHKDKFYIMELINNSEADSGLIISDYLINKGSIDGDSIAKAWGYYGKYMHSDRIHKAKYLDSIINVTIGLNKMEYPLFGYALKAEYYFDIDKFDIALENYLLAQKEAVKNNHKFYKRYTLSAIANIKFISMNYEEALNMYHQVIELYKNDDENLSFEYMDSMNVNFNIGLCHYYLKQKDSVLYYSLQGLNQRIKKKDTSLYYDYLRLNGMGNYLAGNPKKTIDSVLKSYKYAKDTIHRPDALYLIALSHFDLDRKDSAMVYLKKIDSINYPIKLYFPEIKEVYFKLYKNSQTKKNLEEQLYYLEKFIKADSILQEKLLPLSNTLIYEYDLPRMKAEKLRLRNLDKTNKYSFIIIAIFFIVIILGTTLYFIKERKTKQRIAELISKPKRQLIPIIEKNDAGVVPIRADIVKKIVLFLKEFEENELYLSSFMSLSEMAKTAKTNNTYLSSYLNKEKGGYSHYINTLRANFAFQDIKTNKNVFKFTIEGLAQKYGFNSARSFNKAFLSIFEVTPKQYLSAIKEQKT